MSGGDDRVDRLQVSSYDSLDRIPDDAARAASFDQHGEIFRSIEWFRCLQATVFSDGWDQRIYVARGAGNDPVGFLACMAPSGSRGLRGMSNYYSLEFGPVLAPPPGADQRRTEIVDAMVDHLADERPRWATLRVECLRSDRDETDLLVDALDRHGFVTRRYQQSENWFLTVGGADFETYFAGRPSQVRKEVPRKERQLRRDHDLRIEIFRGDDDDLTPSIDAFVQVYNNSWKEREPYPEFIPTFIRMCAGLSILRLGVAYVDGVPAAAQLWINTPARTYIYKVAYDEAFAWYSVGAILSRELFRHAIDVDGAQEIDYGIGSESYKRQWMSDVRTLDRVDGYRAASLRGSVELGWSTTSRSVAAVRSRLRRT